MMFFDHNIKLNGMIASSEHKCTGPCFFMIHSSHKDQAGTNRVMCRSQWLHCLDYNNAVTSKKYISLSAPQGREYTQFLWYSVSHSPHTLKDMLKKNIFTDMYTPTELWCQIFLPFYALCQTIYWLCYDALREYVAKMTHNNNRSVQNIPNLSN